MGNGDRCLAGGVGRAYLCAMGIAAHLLDDWHAAEAALMWQIDLGVEEWVLDAPINRYDLPEAVKTAPVAAPAVAAPRGARPVPPAPPPDVPKIDTVAEGQRLAQAAQSLSTLRDALAGFEHCELKRGARNLVFSDGLPGARVMILGEAPDADEDRDGRPCVGKSGALLDEMFAAIGLSRRAAERASALYIAPAVPWRAVGNGGEPQAEDIAMLRPFVMRHIELAQPEVVIAMGATPFEALTGTTGIGRARGRWSQVMGRPLLPMLHPNYLLRTPAAKREAWADLLALEARLTT